MVIERLLHGDKIKTISNKFCLSNCLRLILTFAIVNFAWIFFRVENLRDVMTIFRKIFMEQGFPFLDSNVLLMCFVAMTIVFAHDIVEEKRLNMHLLSSKFKVVRYATAALMIVYILAFGVLNGGSFIYFQF